MINLTNAIVNKRVPKNRFKSDLSNIDSIIWLYKISPFTTSLASSDNIDEIQIFEVRFIDKINKAALFSIQNEIPYQIIFKALFRNAINYFLVYNRIVLEYNGELIDNDILLVSAITLKGLQDNLIRCFTGLEFQENETAEQLVNRFIYLQKVKRERDSLIKQRDAEKNPRKKFEINEKIRKLQDEIKATL